ncbi:DUF3383 family protein [Lactobacillus xujianguonis]|uniref:DUF3383 family protein n=1 Tax=Lactobacillus xujianguonis TaxID=2495899 RepID=A0A437STB0_9LACO|nr:DUF3383 family protein [Lactobacillus xujianguonis]RVU70163.1 DUF3383 family protein [Lactobacillus xujianguonis]
MADTKTIFAPYDRISDVNVIMTVIHPKPVVDLGNLLILNGIRPTAPAEPAGDHKQNTQPTQLAGGNAQGTTPKGQGSQPAQPVDDGAKLPKLPDELSNVDRMHGILLRKTDPATGAVYREYKNIDAVASDYDEDSEVYKKASAYFAQDHHSDRVAVLEYDTNKLYDSLKAFWYFNWTFAINVDPALDDVVLKESNIFEINKDHFLVLQTDDLAKFTNFYGQNYTIGLYHRMDEAMDAAFIGAIAARPVGSVTWKFKELKGITPSKLTTQELSGINNAHAQAYVEVFGRGETSEGRVMSGEYIDVLHGVLWVQTKFEGDLETLLQSNGKIPYEQSGINMILATGTQVLEEAHERGIIRTNETNGKADYTITATPRSEQSMQDLSDRHYSGLSFRYHVQGAIHTITVNGIVDSDTIMQ